MVTLTARPGNVEIDLARTALIVVDMQNAYVSKGGMLDLAGMDVSGAQPVIEAHRRILPGVRAAGVKVIYLQFGYKADLSDAGGPKSPNYNRHMALRMLRENPDYGDQLIIENTWGWEIVDELKPERGDIVVPKPRFSGFTSTPLESILRSADIQYLIFTGVATNICVESTARDAY
ncbi:MAG: cysteine hydrolase, partial [bacterium]|nr:cysteine hydrolase [bacterium]